MRNVYEAMFILDSNRFGRDPDGAWPFWPILSRKPASRFSSVACGKNAVWLPHQGACKGTYWLIYLSLDPSQLADLRRQYDINEMVLLLLFLKSMRGSSMPW